MRSADRNIEEALAKLDHPAAEEVRELDRLILARLPEAQHGVKWNSVSYRTSEWFLTFRSHPKERIEFVLHLGAKPRSETSVRAIPDPGGLLSWKAPDRACVTFKDRADFSAKTPVFLDLIEEWIKHV